MSAGPEARIENAVNSVANDLGIPHKKLNGFGSNHWPDREYFIPGGKPLIIEYKVPGKPQTENQKKLSDELQELGYDFHVIDNKSAGIALLRSRLGTSPVPKTRNKVHVGKRSSRNPTRPRPR